MEKCFHGIIFIDINSLGYEFSSDHHFTYTLEILIHSIFCNFFRNSAILVYISPENVKWIVYTFQRERLILYFIVNSGFIARRSENVICILFISWNLLCFFF